jgi:hypothetical protein
MISTNIYWVYGMEHMLKKMWTQPADYTDLLERQTREKNQ